MLSQAARRQPPPRPDAAFLREWEGLSVFDTYQAARQLGLRFKWRHGEYIAVLQVPDNAPIAYSGPDRRGHWLLYDVDGRMLVENSAAILLDYVIRVVHGPSHDE
jgi:hypothetical protein